MISALFNCLLGPCLKTSALMMVIPHESEFKLILFDPPPWSSQNVPDPVQKYFTTPSVPDHDEAGFRVLTVLMPQNGGRAGAGALLAAPGVGKVGGHMLCVSWGPKQLLLWVKEGRNDPSRPSPASARALHALAAWGGRKEGASLPWGSSSCHFFSGSLTGPVFQTSSNKNKPIK